MFGLDTGEGAVELRIDEQNRSSRVLDDVANLFGVEAEVDRDEDPTVGADTVERDQKPGRVGTDDGDALADADPQVVERAGHAPGPPAQLVIRHPSERPRCARLVDHRRTRREYLGAPLEEVADGEGNSHRPSVRRRRSGR